MGENLKTGYVLFTESYEVFMQCFYDHTVYSLS